MIKAPIVGPEGLRDLSFGVAGFGFLWIGVLGFRGLGSSSLGSEGRRVYDLRVKV